MANSTSSTTVEEQIGYGLETVDADRIVTLPLRDLLRIHATLGVLINFFHQPMHYQAMEDIELFLGDRHAGAFSAICSAYYDLLRDVWPSDIDEDFANGRFDNPAPPSYLTLKDNERD